MERGAREPGITYRSFEHEFTRQRDDVLSRRPSGFARGLLLVRRRYRTTCIIAGVCIFIEEFHLRDIQ